MNKKPFVAIFLPIVLAFSGSVFADDDEKIQWSDVPAVAQKTITENSGQGAIEVLEKETEMISGKKTTIYEATVRQPDGKKIEIKVGEDGKLIEIDKD